MKLPNLITLILFLPLLLTAQKKLQNAEKEFLKGDLYEAVIAYELAFKSTEFEKNDPDKILLAYFNYAEACRYTYRFNEAEAYYKKVLESPKASLYPSAEFYYAFSLKHLAKYDSAKAEFEKFLAKDNGSSKEMEQLKRQTAQEILSCELARELVKTPIESLEITKLDENVNSQFADFAPHLVGEDLYYSTMQFEANSDKRREHGDASKQHLYGKLMKAEDSGQGKGKQLEKLNVKYKNVGNSAISLDGKRLYFAMGKKEKEFNYDIIAKLYVAEFDEKRQKWGNPLLLPFNSEDGTNTQPNVSYDSTLNKEVIFFTSSRKGGQGGTDIWRVTYNGNGNYSTAENLGKTINTEGNEVTPFFNKGTQTLFFSSNWHPNLGGFDIFSAKDSSGVWTIPLNVGVPLNSAANDIYLYISPMADSVGYISSNRIGSKVLVGKACCNDIYALSLPTDLKPGKPEEIIAVNNPDSVAAIDVVIAPDTFNRNPIEPEPISNPEPLNLTALNNLEKLLPLTLYFHDNTPVPNKDELSTAMSYTQTYNWFITFKDYYGNQYATLFNTAAEKAAAKDKVKAFFSEQVEKEFGRMNEAFLQLQKVLESGETVELEIVGYASRLGSSDYNTKLTKRRISSIKNELMAYNKGVLKTYIDSGKFKITEKAIGETEAPSSVSDSAQDPGNSIFSPDASALRKININFIKK